VYWLRYPIIVLSLIPFTYADSAVQTDWSGGPGVLGPVIDWSTEFYNDTGMSYSNPSDLVLQKSMLLIPLEHTVDLNFDGALTQYTLRMSTETATWMS